MNTSFVERLDRERSLVYYIRSTPDDENPCWFFLKLDPPKRAAFDRAIGGTEMFDLKDYGEILHSGFGESASEELKQEMHEIWGVEYKS